MPVLKNNNTNDFCPEIPRLVRRRVSSLSGIVVVLMISACAMPNTRSADGYELANIDIANIVPKSSPKAFVTAFENFCLPGVDDPASLPTRLRAADYVEVPARGNRMFRFFVVDDKRPAVGFSVTATGVFCGVSAESRTGQANRVQSSVAANFPLARPMDPASISADAERAWAVGDGSGKTIFTLRFAGTAPAKLTYAVFKPG